MTSAFTLETLTAAVGSTVTVAGFAPPLTVSEVTADSAAYSPPGRPPGFSVLLAGPAAPVLAEGTHDLRLGDATHSLHIIPVSLPGTAGQFYQIVMN